MISLSKFTQLSIFSICCLVGQTALANPTGFAVLNGYYKDASGGFIFKFNGTKKAGYAEGSVCQFDGKLSQPNISKLDFIYKTTSSDGTIEDCDKPQPLKIHVISVDPSTGIANKFKITASANDRILNGTYVKD